MSHDLNPRGTDNSRLTRRAEFEPEIIEIHTKKLKKELPPRGTEDLQRKSNTDVAPQIIKRPLQKPIETIVPRGTGNIPVTPQDRGIQKERTGVHDSHRLIEKQDIYRHAVSSTSNLTSLLTTKNNQTPSVTSMSLAYRLMEVFQRSKAHLGPEASTAIDALLSPTNLAIVVATLVAWAASHLFGVGEVIDLILFVVGVFAIGWSIGDVAKAIYTFADLTINAQNQNDLDKAASAFAHAVITAGITVVMALLLRRSFKQLQARGPNVIDALKPRQPGLPNVGTDPYAGQRWSRPGILSDPTLPPGEGSTSAFGEVRLSPLGTAIDQALARAHELVHRFLTPRFSFLRTFRVRLGTSGYLNSALLKYLEEALSETTAQLRVIGFKGVLTGIRFPVDNGYVTVSSVLTEGESIGSIIAGSTFFQVQFVSSDKHQ